jgi:hypothetical protein
MLPLAGGTMSGTLTMGDQRMVDAQRVGFNDGGMITQVIDTDDMAGAGATTVSSSESIKAYVDANAGGTAYWNQIVAGYALNKTSTSYYYTFYRNWYENWSNADSSPSTISYTDAPSSFFIAPRAGTITNIKIQGYANDTGATDPFKFYFFKAAMSNGDATMSLTSMFNTGTITPSAGARSLSFTLDVSADNAFAEDDNLFVWWKKDSNSGSQDVYFTLNINGEYD